MLRLKLKGFLRQHGITETALADAIADTLIASGDDVSDRFLRYLTQNTEAITPDNTGKKPSLLKLGFIIRGLRHLTGEEIVVSDILEYMADDEEIAVAQEEVVLSGQPSREPSRALHPPEYVLVYAPEEEDNEVMDEVWTLTLRALKDRGHEKLSDRLETFTAEGRDSRGSSQPHARPAKRVVPFAFLLALLVASLAYIGYEHFIVRPQLYERFTRLISFRDRVRPTSALAVPTLIGPEGEIDQLTPVLRVSEVPGAAAYEFYVENLVSHDGAYSGPVPNSSFPVPEDTLCPNTAYEWRARALGEDGWTSFSSPVQFMVSNAAQGTNPELNRLTAIRTKPKLPTVVAPIGSTNTATPTLQVEVDPNVYGYGFYIRDLQTDKIVYDNNFASTNEIRVPEGVLEDGGVYQWNTRSRNCHYWSDFTPAQIFTVQVND